MLINFYKVVETMNPYLVIRGLNKYRSKSKIYTFCISWSLNLKNIINDLVFPLIPTNEKNILFWLLELKIF
jgi:hypothetical protein